LYQEGNRLLAVNVNGPNGQRLRGSKYAANNQMTNSNVNEASSNLPATKVFRRRKLTNN